MFIFRIFNNRKLKSNFYLGILVKCRQFFILHVSSLVKTLKNLNLTLNVVANKSPSAAGGKFEILPQLISIKLLWFFNPARHECC